MRSFPVQSDYDQMLGRKDPMAATFIQTVRSNVREALVKSNTRFVSIPLKGEIRYDKKPEPRAFPLLDSDPFEMAEATKVEVFMESSHELVAEPMLDVNNRYLPIQIPEFYDCKVTGYRSALGYFASSFRSDFPSGTSLEQLCTRPRHWFIDMANQFPYKFRESDGDFPIMSYVDCIRLNPIRPGDTIYIVTEAPGRNCCIFLDSSWNPVQCRYGNLADLVVVKCHPRIAHRAGADNEFRSLVRILRRIGGDVLQLYFSSRDKHWVKFSNDFRVLSRDLRRSRRR